jgi:peptidyl-prolyl cis-trans isomerase SurA
MTAATWIKSTSATMWVRVLAMFVVLAVGGVAMAQSVVVFVNGDPVTAIDIDQRTKFHVMTGQKASSRQKVLDELIDEILKVREGKRWGMEISNEDVDSSFTRMARGMGKSPSELSQFLAQKGTGAGTLKAKIRADMIWQQLVRGRYSGKLKITDKEVISTLDDKGSASTVGYEYTLRPILFLVPPGAQAATYDARRREAEALRKTFKGCNESIPAVRAMRDVAVRSQVVRSSSSLPENLRKVLDSVPPGELTPPELTRLGIEMFAVCSRYETKSDTASIREAREKLEAKAFEKESKRYLRELRKNAMIEPGK